MEVLAEPSPLTEPYMQSAKGLEEAVVVSSGRDNDGDCGRDSGRLQKNMMKCHRIKSSQIFWAKNCITWCRGFAWRQ